MGLDWVLPVLGVVLPLERQRQAPGAASTLLWDPHLPPGQKFGLSAQVGVRISASSPPSPPWPQRGVSPAYLRPGCILHPSGQELPGWAAAAF